MASLDLAICTYNRADELDACLHAIAGQQDISGNWRVTVIDNNCTDRTAEVVDRHIRAGHIPYLKRIVEQVQGLTPARHRAIRDSEAHWIAFVDDDCRIAPDWVASALRYTAEHPDVGALGGEVILDWGRRPAGHLTRHGWLFAEQRHGCDAQQVESLVGTGLILNKSALAAVGWLDGPLIADRVGKGFVSGGDVEISLRLRAGGFDLHYVPALRLHHHVSTSRQDLRALLRLAHGLGGGAELVALLNADATTNLLADSEASLRAALDHHRGNLRHVHLRGEYTIRDWLIHRAFLRGRWKQNRALQRDDDLVRRLAGACRR